MCVYKPLQLFYEFLLYKCLFYWELIFETINTQKLNHTKDKFGGWEDIAK